VSRVLWILLALALALAAAYALVRRPSAVMAPPVARSEEARPAPPGASAARDESGRPPHADIDDASRAELERIIREADERDEAAKRR